MFERKRDAAMNPAFILLVFGVSVVLGGVVLSGLGWHSRRTASRLTRPLSRIGKLRPGPRKVRGKVAVCEETLRSPMTNQECVYYRLRVYEEERKWRATDVLRGSIVPTGATMNFGFFYTSDGSFTDSMGGGNARAVYKWHNVLDEAVSVPFHVEDDSGCVEVDVRGADVNAKTKARMATSMHEPVLALSDLTDRLRDEHGIDAVDERGNFKTLHFVEEVLLIGAKATVLGSVESMKGGTLCFHADEEPLLVTESDVAKEGRAARKRALGFVLGSGGALIVGIASLLGALALFLRTSPAR